jgi:hypothetical protein
MQNYVSFCLIIEHVGEKNFTFYEKRLLFMNFKKFTQKFTQKFKVMSTFNHHLPLLGKYSWPPTNSPKWGETPGKILLAKI